MGKKRYESLEKTVELFAAVIRAEDKKPLQEDIMNRLEELRERGIKAKQEIETIIPILAKKERIPENFGGREALRMRSASETATSAIMMLNHYLRQVDIYIENELEPGDFEAEVENYLKRLEGEIPSLEETANLEPAERTIVELNAELLKLTQAIEKFGFCIYCGKVGTNDFSNHGEYCALKASA